MTTDKLWIARHCSGLPFRLWELSCIALICLDVSSYTHAELNFICINYTHWCNSITYVIALSYHILCVLGQLKLHFYINIYDNIHLLSMLPSQIFKPTLKNDSLFLICQNSNAFCLNSFLVVCFSFKQHLLCHQGIKTNLKTYLRNEIYLSFLTAPDL